MGAISTASPSVGFVFVYNYIIQVFGNVWFDLVIYFPRQVVFLGNLSFVAIDWNIHCVNSVINVRCCLDLSPYMLCSLHVR